MDESFSALDAQTRLQMQEMLLELWTHHRMTVIFVTHDIDEAIFLGDRVVVISPRPGRIRAELPVTLERPRTADALTTSDFMQIKRQCMELIRPEISTRHRRRTWPRSQLHYLSETADVKSAATGAGT